MPRYVVCVERLAPQWRTIVVEAPSEDEIHSAKKRILDHAQDLEWITDEDEEGVKKIRDRFGLRHKRVTPVEVTEDEPDLIL